MRAAHVAIVVSVAGLLLPLRASGAPANSMVYWVDSFSTARGFTVDRAPKGVISKGDVVWEKDVLRNHVPQFGRPSGVLVGHDYVTFTVLSKRVAIATGVTRLPGGTLRELGRERDAQGGEISIIGGTGVFAYAQGTVLINTLMAWRCAIKEFDLHVP